VATTLTGFALLSERDTELPVFWMAPAMISAAPINAAASNPSVT
jgi:hypothetical protein